MYWGRKIILINKSKKPPKVIFFLDVKLANLV